MVERISAAHGGGGSPASKGISAALASMAIAEIDPLQLEAFEREVTSVEELLGGFKASARDGGLAPEEDKEEERLHRRLLAERMQEDRKKPALPGAHQKVADRLELHRLDDDGCPDIPMQRLIVSGTAGARERVPIVDVLALRHRCKHLQPGVRVGELLEIQRAEERRPAPLSRTQTMPLLRSAPGSPTNASALSLKGLNDSQVSHASNDPRGFGERWQMVRQRKQASKYDGMLHKLNSMRGQPPELMLKRFDGLANEVSSSGLRDVDLGMETLIRERSAGHRTPKFVLSYAGSKRVSLSDSFQSSVDLKDLLKPETPGDLDRTASASLGSMTGKTRLRFLAAMRFTKKQARLHLASMWAAVRFLLLFFGIRRRNNAVGLVKTFMKEMGDWARLKAAMTRFNESIRVLTVACKTFIHARRHRLAEMNRTWQLVEDHHLSNYFEQYAKLVIEEAQEDAARGRGPMKKRGEMESLKMADPSKVDWQKLRIPEEERICVINRYYTAQLQKHIRNKRDLLQMFDEVVTEARELREVNKFLVATSPQASKAGDRDRATWETMSEGLQGSSFWHMTESTVLDMIALSAYELRNVEPFKRHPSNAGPKLGSPMARGGVQGTRWEVLALPDKQTDAEKAGLQRQREEMNKSQMPSRFSKEASGNTGEWSTAEESRDMDELLQRFTPRLCWEVLSKTATARK